MESYLHNDIPGKILKLIRIPDVQECDTTKV